MTIALHFATPRKLPKATELVGRVVVLDVAFASETGGASFGTTTLPFLRSLGDRLAAWVDHHDSAHHADYSGDPRFLLTTKAEHGACPELVTPELVARVGAIDTLVCHGDFDGLMSAAKWLRGGAEPYPGADDDARAIDTRVGTPSPLADRLDRALRARPRDTSLPLAIVRFLEGGASDEALLAEVDRAAAELDAHEREARRIAEGFAVFDEAPGALAFVDATKHEGPYDKTLLLLLGQTRARVAAVLDDDTLTLAAPFESGVNFLDTLGLSGGMPTRVSLPRKRMAATLTALGLPPAAIAQLPVVERTRR
jgi:hypothetical protein